MKKMIFVMLLLICFVNLSFAQRRQKGVLLTGSLGPGFPVTSAPYRDYYARHIGFGIGCQFQLSLKNRVGIHLDYRSNHPDFDAILEQMQPIPANFQIHLNGGDIQIVSVSVRYRFDLISSLHFRTFYSIVGCGVYAVTKSSSEWITTVSDKELKEVFPSEFTGAFGGLLGFGYEYIYSRHTAVSLELIFHQLFTPESLHLDDVHVNLDDSISHPGYLELMAGVQYSL